MKEELARKIKGTESWRVIDQVRELYDCGPTIKAAKVNHCEPGLPDAALKIEI